MGFIKNIGDAFKQLKPQLVKKSVMEGVRKVVAPSARKKFGQAKFDMLNEIRNHPVIKAIEAGPGDGDYDPLNILGGYGDICSFIGFKNGQQPAAALIDLFTRIEFVPDGSQGLTLLWTIKNFPTIADIEKVTPLPWAPEKSWATELEVGVSGLGRYLNKKLSNPPSRSNYGIQVKHDLGRGPKKSRPIKWIRPFLSQWRRSLETLDNTKIL